MVTTTVIPKAKLTTCRRWKLDSLDLSEAHPVENRQAKTLEENIVSSPAAEEIASVFQSAKEDGYKQGHEEGYKSGFQEGQNKGYLEGREEGESETKTELARINTLFVNLDQHLRTVDQQVAQDLLTLAIDLTKKMITEALTIHPELILPIVQEAIRQLPVSSQHPRLYLHPEDAKLFRRFLSEDLSRDNWEIREDEQQEKGGCRIETGGGEIDASIETRWRRILATIGQKNDWIEK